MNAAPLRPAAGRHTAEGHVLPVRVYFEDTDFSGVVYHASYLRFMERGRSEFLRALGLVQSAMAAGDAPVLFVVRHMAIDFLKPARLDDLLVVETAPAERIFRNPQHPYTRKLMRATPRPGLRRCIGRREMSWPSSLTTP